MGKRADLNGVERNMDAEGHAPRSPLPACFKRVFPGSSETMEEALQMAVVASSNRKASVLLRGEQGVPMRKLALAIHKASGCAESSFLALSSAGMSRTAFESALFASGEGGLLSSRISSLGGAESVFVDEIANLSQRAQRGLLEYLEFRRSADSLQASPRLFSASSKDLENLVEQGLFGKDLFYMASVLPVFVPPLRERRADLPAMLSAFLDAFACESGRRLELSDGAFNALLSYSWPGNDAELESCLAYAASKARSSRIELAELPPAMSAAVSSSGSRGLLSSALDKLERELVEGALAACAGNMARAAASLGVTERVMGLRVKKFGLALKAFKR